MFARLVKESSPSTVIWRIFGKLAKIKSWNLTRNVSEYSSMFVGLKKNTHFSPSCDEKRLGFDESQHTAMPNPILNFECDCCVGMCTILHIHLAKRLATEARHAVRTKMQSRCARCHVEMASLQFNATLWISQSISQATSLSLSISPKARFLSQ